MFIYCLFIVFIVFTSGNTIMLLQCSCMVIKNCMETVMYSDSCNIDLKFLSMFNGYVPLDPALCARQNLCSIDDDSSSALILANETIGTNNCVIDQCYNCMKHLNCTIRDAKERLIKIFDHCFDDYIVKYPKNDSRAAATVSRKTFNMRTNVKFRITDLLIFFSFVTLATSKCQIFLTEVNSPILPFLNEIPEYYNATGGFDVGFDEYLKEYKSHQNNFFEFERYCENFDDESNGTYGFAVIEIYDKVEYVKPIILQYFKFHESSFINGSLTVGNVHGKILNEQIQIQKLTYEKYINEPISRTRKFGISNRYLYLLFEITPKTSWINVHFEYDAKYVDDKIEKLTEASIDAFILSEEYGVGWIKRLMTKLNVPAYDYKASSTKSWTRCCNSWFISDETAGTENACCSADLKILRRKAIPPNFKESVACKVPGCLLSEGQHVNITAENGENLMATVIRMKSKNVKVKYFQNSIEYHTVVQYDSIFSQNPHITMFNCTSPLPEIVDIDELDKGQVFPKQDNTKDEIFFCYFNDTLKEKLCAKFYINQNITVTDVNGKESIARITSVYTKSNMVFAVTPEGNTKTYLFDVLKKHNPQNFYPKACMNHIFASIPTKTINVDIYNRSVPISKLLHLEQNINFTIDDVQKTGTLTKLMQTFGKIKDDETGVLIRYPYTKIIAENPSIFADLDTDKALELCYSEENGNKRFCTLLKLNQQLNYFFNGTSYNGIINKIYGDIGVVVMFDTDNDVMENVPTTAEEIHFTNFNLFKEVLKDVSPLKCSKSDGNQFNKHHLHQRKKSDCNV